MRKRAIMRRSDFCSVQHAWNGKTEAYSKWGDGKSQAAGEKVIPTAMVAMVRAAHVRINL